MIVVTGSARTGTSLMMRILKEIGIEVPAPKFSKHNVNLKEYNPLGFFEQKELQMMGVQSTIFKDKAVKLFGYALSITPKELVSKVIVCRRMREPAIQSFKPVFRDLYQDEDRKVMGKDHEYRVYDEHYRYIDKCIESFDHITVNLEDIRFNPARSLVKIILFLNIKPPLKTLENIIDSIHPYNP